MLWQFSESSQPLLKRCMEVSTIDENNKWVKNFGHLLQNRNLNNDIIKNGMEIINLSSPVTISDSQATDIIEKLDISEEVLRELLEADPVERFDFIYENCLNNSTLYSKLAKQLSLTSIEKLCSYIFETKNIESEFLENFYRFFLPEFLKREHSISSIDIMIKAEKCNSMFFKYFLETIIKDTELPSQVLQQYISTLDDKSQLELMKSVALFDLSNEVFLYHLYSICMLYKNCQKTEEIQKFILLKLSHVSQQCINDKNYGRLLLNYLQAQKNFTTNFMIVQKIVNLHRSPFKKPCINTLNDLQELQG